MEKHRKILAAVLAVLALAVAVTGVWLAIANMDAEPVLVRPSDQALATAQEMLQAVSDGDYDRAGRLILGCPELGVDREAESEVGRLIWKAYQDSLSFTPEGACYATDAGIAQNYRVRYLDRNSVTARLRERSRALLEERVANAEDTSQVYDENNEYREDVVMEVLAQAAEQALREDAAYVELVVPVGLTYENGAWWVLPEEQLLAAISGGLAG